MSLLLSEPLHLNGDFRYDPAEDAWSATPANHVPEPRWQHSAIWTGSEMIVWGGTDKSDAPLSSGARPAPEPSGGAGPHVVFAPSADDWLVRRVREVREAQGGEHLTVVTADRRLADRLRAQDVEVETPSVFLARCPS